MMKRTMMTSIKMTAVALAAFGLSATASLAEMATHEVTETKTITGTVSEVTPSSRIVVTSSSGPVTYSIDKKTVFVDESGNVVSYEQVRNQPVKIYVSEAKAEQPVIVERVVLSKPVTVTQPGQVMQRTETRTETRHEE